MDRSPYDRAAPNELPGASGLPPTEVGAEAVPPENSTAVTFALDSRFWSFAMPLPPRPDTPTETGTGCAVLGNVSAGTPAAWAAVERSDRDRCTGAPSVDSRSRWSAAAPGRSVPLGADG